jgi:hypothetical protein
MSVPTAIFTQLKLRCSGGIVQGEVNGDGVADFEIKVNVLTLHGSDLFL